MKNMRIRAWDGERMHSTEDTSIIVAGVENLFIFFEFLKRDMEKYGKSYTLLKCTYMQDCEGTWIYEGDIVELQLDRLDEEERKYYESMRYEVVYRKCCAYFAFKLIGRKNWFTLLDQEVVGKLYKVIGNIYENSELLEGRW